MKNTIHFYYNLNFDEIYEYDNYSILIVSENIYAFKVLNVSMEELVIIMNALQSNNIKTNKIILNKNNEIYTEYNGKKYVLTLIENKETINQFYLFPLINSRREDFISEIWVKKIEYYVKKIPEVGLGNGWLINSFNYYIGMAENAIAVYNRCNKNNVRYIISHRRLNYPLTKTVFLDPTNLLIDAISRDVSEYMKIKFISEEYDILEIRKIVEKYNFNNDEMNILLARLLYPSYYFDELDQFIEKKEAKNLKKIVSKIDNYEKMIKKFCNEFKDYQLYVIDWIKK